jgi:3-oxoacyl-[acyl-carrier protein] reductase
MQRLEGKIAIVTGAASGIGRAIADLFAAEGAHVIGVDLNEAGGRAQSLIVDIAQPAEVAGMVEQVVKEHGQIDILVNNAGLDQAIIPVAEMGLEEWDRIMNVNARGTFLCSRHVLPIMIDGDSGVIVNIASDLGYVVVPGLGAYCASKGAVLQLTRVMAAENGPHNIRVNALCPTMVDTPMARRTMQTHADPDAWLSEIENGIPLGRIGTAQEVASAALFLASDEAAYVNGVCLPVDGGRTIL